MQITLTLDGKTFVVRVSHPVGGNPDFTEYQIDRWADGPHGRRSSRKLLDIYGNTVLVKTGEFDGKVYREYQIGDGSWITEPIAGAELYY